MLKLGRNNNVTASESNVPPAPAAGAPVAEGWNFGRPDRRQYSSTGARAKCGTADESEVWHHVRPHIYAVRQGRIPVPVR